MTTTSARKSFLRNFFDAYVAARERQAAHYVNGAMLRLDDATLEANGFKRSELAKRKSLYSVI